MWGIRLDLRLRSAPDGLQEPAVVEPVKPFERREPRTKPGTVRFIGAAPAGEVDG